MSDFAVYFWLFVISVNVSFVVVNCVVDYLQGTRVALHVLCSFWQAKCLSYALTYCFPVC